MSGFVVEQLAGWCVGGAGEHVVGKCLWGARGGWWVAQGARDAGGRVGEMVAVQRVLERVVAEP